MRLFPRLAKRAAADRPSYQTRKLAPVVEACESRQLLSTCPASPVTGLGTIAGTAFVDLNNDGHLNGGDTYLKGVTVQLYKADGSKCPIQTTQTDSLGAYSFTGVKPGDYLVKEIAPRGYKSTGTEVNSDLNPASGVACDTIKVTVVDPSKVFLNYNGLDGDRYAYSDVILYGQTQPNAYGPMKVSLGTTAGATNLNTGYLSICVDDTQSLSFTGPSSFQVKPSPMAALTGDAAVGGRVAYLFNHYGNSSLTNVTGPALQLAIWELVYDGADEATADFTSGDFQLSGDVTTINGASAADVIAQAKQFFAESAGKSETAVFLKTSTNAKDGQQSMLAHGSLNFANTPNCPPKDSNPCDGGKDKDHGPRDKDHCDRDDRDDRGPKGKDDCGYDRDHGPKGKNDRDRDDNDCDDRGGKGDKPNSCDRDRDRNDRGPVCDTGKPSKSAPKSGGDCGWSIGGHLFDGGKKGNGCR